MKKIQILIISSILFYTSLYSQSGWIEYSTGFNNNINNIFFVNANTGWAVGDSIILKSTNGGVNWSKQNYTYVTKVCFNSVKFINENTGFVAGGHHSGYYDFYYQYIFKTTNGGVNWNLVFNIQGGANSYIAQLHPIDQNNMFIATVGSANNASSGYVAKSDNGGSSFSNEYGRGECNSIYCINSQVAYASFYSWFDYPSWVGRICKTTNGGTNWVELYKDSLYSSSQIKSMYFVNQNTGFAVGKVHSDISRFFKTTNGGAHWDTLTYNNRKYNSVFFVNENIGWIGGYWLPDSSSISYTSNGGVNWSKQKKNYPAIVTNLYFINAFTGWATLSYSNKILKTITGGEVTVRNISSEIPDKYSLNQNYPNPFNPATNIKYQIIKNQFVSIKVFDILGKEISTLVNEKQSPGIYEVSFDGSNFPSGIYFYKLETNSFSDTKRMILIK
jgi:photosystem II stability/assembly factor-like uncharacterized protein